MRRTAAAGIAGAGVAVAVAMGIALADDDDRRGTVEPPPPPSDPLVPGSSEPSPISELYVVGTDGRGLRRVARAEASFRNPSWAPDARSIAVVASVPLPRGRLRTGVEVLDLRGRRVRRFKAEGSLRPPAWSPDSKRLAYVAWNTDPPRRRTAQGAPLTVADVTSGRKRVVSTRARGWAQGGPDWSPDGDLIVFTSIYLTRIPADPPRIEYAIAQPELSVVRPDGTGERRLTRDPPHRRQPRGSDEEDEPQWLNERRIAYVSLTTPPDLSKPRSVRVVDRSGGRPRTVIGLHYAIPEASPDGRRIAFVGTPPPAQLIRLFSLDVATGDLSTLVNHNVVERPTWSPDGRHIAFALGDRIEAVRRDGRRRRTIFRLPGRPIREVAWSPDGRRIAFTTIATRRVPTLPQPPIIPPSSSP